MSMITPAFTAYTKSEEFADDLYQAIKAMALGKDAVPSHNKVLVFYSTVSIQNFDFDQDVFMELERTGLVRRSTFSVRKPYSEGFELTQEGICLWSEVKGLPLREARNQLSEITQRSS